MWLNLKGGELKSNLMKDMEIIKPAYADLNNIPTNKPQLPELKIYDLQQLVNFATSLVLFIGVAITVIFLIIGGIRYITSGGDKEAATQARGMITNAVIGFIIVIAAWAIRTIVQNLLGATNMPNNL